MKYAESGIEYTQDERNFILKIKETIKKHNLNVRWDDEKETYCLKNESGLDINIPCDLLGSYVVLWME